MKIDSSMPFPRSYWVIPNVFLAGEFPGAKDPNEARQKLERLYDVGIRYIINLMELDETDHDGNPFHSYKNDLKDIAEKQNGSISFSEYPIKDLHIPNNDQMTAILDVIDAAIDAHKPVYVHCWGGIGRTGTVVGCFLIRHGLATSRNVLDAIHGLRKNDLKNYRVSPETSAQVKFVKAWRNKIPHPPTTLSRYLGCMIGGAVGDALGAPVEFMSLSQIRHKYGEDGIKDYDRAYGRIGAITDDTQMAMFTAEGVLRAWSRGSVRGVCYPPSVVYRAYLRWLRTQESEGHDSSDHTQDGFLVKIPELYSRRAPGNSCLSALHASEMGTVEKPVNNSKGCGGVMRVASVGLIEDSPEKAFELGCQVAAITHGHPSGYLSSGALAAIINILKQGMKLPDAIDVAVRLLKQHREHQECVDAINQAVTIAKNGNPRPELIKRMGEGWVAEEALAISLYCSLCAQDDFKKGVVLAVNHSGDSDSTGAITGNILGCLLGNSAIPEKWIAQLELNEVIQQLGVDLFLKFRSDSSWWNKYPGW